MGARDTPSMAADESALLFGPFTLLPGRGELRQDGAVVPLAPRTIALLLLLAGRAGEVIGKDEIARQLWPADAHEHHRLRAHVAALRRALGEGVGGSRWIVNVLGRGYVFVGAVRRLHADRPVAGACSPDKLPRLLGRDDAVALLAAQAGVRRLVTIVGAGGVGKSVTALAATAKLGPVFADGVAWFDLAALADGHELPGALAAALGIATNQADPVPVLTLLCNALASRRFLLVLDNCGHLPDAAALLAERVLGACARVHMLATSREALCVQGEWVYRLPPLPVPAPDASPDDAMMHPAVCLFAQRVGEIAPAAMPRVVQLCRQLDGNPLAIELAAAQSRNLGIEALATSLDLLFEADAGTGRPGPARHRTLDALLDWSYRLLGPRERTVLRRLAVLRGAFTLDVAVGACAGTGIDAADVVEAILVLGARSLVEVEDGDTAARYRLSNTTRLYALRRRQTPTSP